MNSKLNLISKGLKMRRTLLAAVLGCAVVAPMTMAATLYSTGFDPATYAPGNLVGQDGWQRFDTDVTPNVPMTVQTSQFSSAPQALQITSNQPGLAQSSFAYHTVSLANVATSGTPNITVQWDMKVNQDTLANKSNIWGIGVYDDTSPGSGGPNAYAFAGEGPDLFNASKLKVSDPTANASIDTGPAAPFDGLFHTYALSLNFQQGLYSVSIDGNLNTIGVMNLTNTNGNLGEIDLFTSGRGIDTAYFDNILVTSGTALVPEPATLGLAAISGLMILARRPSRKETVA